MSGVRLDAAAEQAIDWMVRLRAGQPSAELQRQLEAWLASDSAHAEAWARLQHGLGSPYETLRHLPGHSVQQLLLEPTHSRRNLLRGLAGLGLFGGSLWLGARSEPGQVLLADLRSGTGERRRFTLADGSQLELNADSAVDLAFDAGQRLVLLRRGELVVQVATNPARPFVVRSVQGEARALGTRFLVSQEADATRVVVLQHAVRVSLPGMRAWRDLGEGEGALLRDDGIQPLRNQTYRADWVEGRLSVVDEPLEAVIDALRPYLRGFIRLQPQARGLRVQGVFPLDDPALALTALGETLPLRIERYGPWLTLISLRE